MTKRKKRGLIAGLIVAGAVATAVLVIIFGFKTKKIVYEGNTRLEDAQITEYVFEGKLPNSIIYKISFPFKYLRRTSGTRTVISSF